VFRNLIVTQHRSQCKHGQPSVAANAIPVNSTAHGSLREESASSCKKGSEAIAGSSDTSCKAAYTWLVPFRALGVHQAQNVAVALSALQLLRARLPLAGSNEDALTAMAQIRTLCKGDLYAIDRAGQSASAAHSSTAACNAARMAA
jgi:folylpolyglutamate synthase/dihydropteroate synthase